MMEIDVEVEYKISEEQWKQMIASLFPGEEIIGFVVVQQPDRQPPEPRPIRVRTRKKQLSGH